MQILVVGSNGLVARQLKRDLSTNLVASTSRKPTNAEPSPVYAFDLETPDFSFLDRVKASHAIICAAETNLDRCKTEFERSQKINVTSMKALIEALWVRSITPVFLSSDAVFEGVRDFSRETDERKPATVYGKQKLEIEKHLETSGKPFLCVRMAKIYDTRKNDGTLLTAWFDAMKAGKTISCATDQYMTATHVRDISGAIKALITGGKTGFYHISSPEKFSRYEIAQMIAKKHGLDAELIEKCSIFDFKFIEPRVALNTLDSSKFRTETGFAFTTLAQAISELA